MPRKPTKKSQSSPLRKLRSIYSEAVGRSVSQKDFADILGISAESLKSLENGRIKSITPDMYQKLHDVLGVSLVNDRWVLWFSPDVEFTAASCAAFLRSPVDHVADARALASRIEVVLETVAKAAKRRSRCYNSTWSRLWRIVEDAASEAGVDTASAQWWRTMPVHMSGLDADGNLTDTRRDYPGMNP